MQKEKKKEWLRKRCVTSIHSYNHDIAFLKNNHLLKINYLNHETEREKERVMGGGTNAYKYLRGKLHISTKKN